MGFHVGTGTQHGSSEAQSVLLTVASSLQLLKYKILTILEILIDMGELKITIEDFP